MKVFVLLLVIVLAKVSCDAEVVHGILSKFMDGSPKELFRVYNMLHSKEYSVDSQEGINRYKAFKANLKFIKSANQQGHSYTLGLTQFSDLTNEEYKQLFTNSETIQQQTQDLINQAHAVSSDYVSFDSYSDRDDEEVLAANSSVNGNTDVDHSSKLSVPKNQGRCGSSWAFAVAAVVEHHLHTTGQTSSLQHLSAQQLLDCEKTSHGCSGGDPASALAYTQSTGLALESDYKYTSETDTTVKPCQLKPNVKTYKIKGFKSNNKPTPQEWLKNINEGPAVVVLDATSIIMQNYQKGILEAKDMTCQAPTHVAVAVGYKDSEKSIKIRNSFGAAWGENGHFRIRLDSTNTCLVTSSYFRPSI